MCYSCMETTGSILQDQFSSLAKTIDLATKMTNAIGLEEG